MSSPLHTQLARRGATILEVLFAIFVVIVGLLGIASLIPLAARNAVESNAHNNAQSLGPRWQYGFTARGLNITNDFEDRGEGYNWIWLQDYGNNRGFRPFRKAYGVPLEVSTIGIAAPNNISLSGTIPNGISALQTVRIWGHQSVCIDPTFFTEPDVQSRILSNTSRVAGYRAAVFPYYEDGFNPVTDPAAPADAWHDQPRMLRVTLGLGASLTQAPVSRKLVDQIFSSTDDLPISTYAQDPATGEQIVDETLPATRLFQSLAGGGLQKSVPNSEFSWLITASPEEPLSPNLLNATTRDYTTTLVIIHRRDKQFIAPGNNPIPGSVEDKPAGERLVWVVPLSGNFTGGTGGRVRLIANAATSSEVHIGDWIMLGKHFLVNPADVTQRYSYFRWYRMVALEQDTHVGPLGTLSPSGTDPYGNAAGQEVWSRDVVLEGPDFGFFPDTLPSGSGAVVVPTTGTLVDGVVTVLERKVTIK